MAKKSKVVKNLQRIELAQKYADKRKELKKLGDFEGLAKLPKNSNPIRIQNRCSVTGRPRGYIGAFGLSRITFRELAAKGYIPGVKKSSW